MADQKLTGLTALTDPAATDIIYVVDDPGGTPLSKKMTFTNLQKTITKHARYFIPNPSAADDYPVARLDVAGTIQKVVFAVKDGTNWIGQLKEATDAQGTGDTNTQASDETVTATSTVTSFTNAGIAAGSYIRVVTTSVSGAVTWLWLDVYWKDA